MTSVNYYSGLILATSLISTTLVSNAAAETENSAIQLSITADAELKSLKRKVRLEQKTCPALDCPNLTLKVEALSRGEVRELGPELRAKLRQISKNMALEIWPDTILEGPYHVQFRMRLDRIERFLQNGEPIGYRLSFSDKAWNTDRCRPGAANLPESQKYKQCDTGRVYDAGFVLNDLLRTFRDESTTPSYEAAGKSRKPAQTDFSLNPAKRKALSGFPRLNIPLISATCDARNVQESLRRSQNLIEDLIYDERGLTVCDDNERSPTCFEEASLVILLGQLEPLENPFGVSQSFRTDPDYALCTQDDLCKVKLRFTCNQPDLTVEIE